MRALFVYLLKRCVITNTSKTDDLKNAVTQVRETGFLEDRKKSSRPPKLTKDDNKYLKTLSLRNTKKASTKLAKDINTATGENVSNWGKSETSELVGNLVADNEEEEEEENYDDDDDDYDDNYDDEIQISSDVETINDSDDI
ncbi:uncharacterized protein LOC136078517 [Hydra vulgaris]|uniref:Uncharacterized protein LOC136078517 n=1 Tax=Hydra vulgaris TaxID=6087 RepID=A0ABM4BMP7_HYDVU